MLEIIELAGLGLNVMKGEVDQDEKLHLKLTIEKKTSCQLAGIQGKKGMINKLLSKGFEFKQRSVNTDTAVSGKKFCITGTLSMKRSDLQKLIKENGGVAVSSVSKATDFLITNDTESSSSKFKKAKELNIPIINEDKFLEMIQ
jgi:DNA ligase (NAD+)